MVSTGFVIPIAAVMLLTFMISAANAASAQSSEGFRIGSAGEGRQGLVYGGISGMIVYGVMASMIGVAGYALVAVARTLLKGSSSTANAGGAAQHKPAKKGAGMIIEFKEIAHRCHVPALE